MLPKWPLLAGIAAICLSLGAFAGEADVVNVKVERLRPGVYAFHVTVTHTDRGWAHFADKWDIVAPDGTVLGTRVLYHPHEHEQPFTRSLTDVAIPPGIDRVTVRAHDKVHFYGGKVLEVTVPR